MSDVPVSEPQVIRVESGNPSPDEVAALVAVLSAVGGDGADAPTDRTSAWSDPSRRLVGPSARPGGWAASALPR